MSTVLFTKLAMANAFKNMMKTYPINKITVKMITDECGVTRHTFYNHFHDVYELLGWIYENEVIEELDLNCNQDNWQQGLALVLDYTYKNQVICSNTCRSLGREHLERFLHNTFRTVIEGAIKDIEVSHHCNAVNEKDIASFFSFAITGEFLQWITSGFKEEKESIEGRIINILTGTISYLVLKESKTLDS